MVRVRVRIRVRVRVRVGMGKQLALARDLEQHIRLNHKKTEVVERQGRVVKRSRKLCTPDARETGRAARGMLGRRVGEGCQS
eukprot:6213599-Pleurochrysis_carterae.AAC.2